MTIKEKILFFPLPEIEIIICAGDADADADADAVVCLDVLYCAC